MSVVADALGLDGAYLASDDCGTTLWPRVLYPSADDALDADGKFKWGWDYALNERSQVRLTWACASQDFGWWYWGDEYRDSWECVECWEIR